MISEVRPAHPRKASGHDSDVAPSHVSLLPTSAGQSHSQPRQSAVFVADLDATARQRLGNLLDTVGIPTSQVESPDGLAECATQGCAGCLVIEPGPALQHAQRWFPAAAADGRPLPVVCLTKQPSIGDAVQAMRSGAWTYLGETVSDHDLLEEIQQALREHARRQAAAAQGADGRAMFAVLSARELEVLQYCLEGLTNRAIAARMGITHRTVDSHRSSSLRKLGVARFSELTLAYCMLLARQGAPTTGRTGNA